MARRRQPAARYHRLGILRRPRTRRSIVHYLILRRPLRRRSNLNRWAKPQQLVDLSARSSSQIRHTKSADLANFIADDVLHLGRSIADSLRNTRQNQTLLHSFFHHAGLTIR